MLLHHTASRLISLLLLLATVLQLTSAVTLEVNRFTGANDQVLLKGLWAKATRTTAVTEVELSRLAREAMVDAQLRTGPKPKALTVMTVDRQTIYYFSSHPGPGDVASDDADERGLMEIQDPVYQALKACMAQYAGTHGNAAKCGEIMSTNQSFKENPGKTTMEAETSKLIVTVKSNGDVIPPCTAQTRANKAGKVVSNPFGCNEYLLQLGWTAAQMIGPLAPAAADCGPVGKRSTSAFGKRAPPRPACRRPTSSVRPGAPKKTTRPKIPAPKTGRPKKQTVVKRPGLTTPKTPGKPPKPVRKTVRPVARPKNVNKPVARLRTKPVARPKKVAARNVAFEVARD